MKPTPAQSALSALRTLLDNLQRQPDHRPTLSDRMTRAAHIYLLAPTSFLGTSFAVPLAQRLLAQGKQVTLVDDTLAGAPATIPGCTVVSTGALSPQPSVCNLAIDMGNTVFASGLFRQVAQQRGLPVMDIIEALDVFDLPVIYQSAQTMRSATLGRIDDYQALATKLDDALSVQTLGACLQMRISGQRHAVTPVLCSLEDEYFSPYPAGKDITFSMGSEEVFCDIGAHVGSTIRKFLTATHWKYASIHAFEPDALNCAALRQGFFGHLHDFHVKNIALSDTRQMLSFSETGTMGSRIDAHGNVQVQASTLDEEMEHATFIKMDVEGHEARILRGAQRLIQQSRPRLAITGYHYADDLLDIAQLIQQIEPRYRLRLRQHSFYYYDTILYADIQDD